MASGVAMPGHNIGYPMKAQLQVLGKTRHLVYSLADSSACSLADSSAGTGVCVCVCVCVCVQTTVTFLSCFPFVVIEYI